MKSRLDPLYDEERLIERLAARASAPGRGVVFLVGSAVSAPLPPGDGLGIPGVVGMLELLAHELGRPPAPARGDMNAYQAGLWELYGTPAGPQAVRRLICRAVLRARSTRDPLAREERALAGDDEVCAELENSPDWWLSPALSAVTQLAVALPTFCGRTILTTNFDPLLEIGIRLAGGAARPVVPENYGDPSTAREVGCEIVHLHGYWRGHFTLHTPMQLTHQRPGLERFLARLLAEKTLVVVGYSGWDDVFSSALAVALGGETGDVEVLWAFHEQGDEQVGRQLQRLFDPFPSALARHQITAFGGVDANSLFPSLLGRLRAASASATTRLGAPAAPALPAPSPYLPPLAVCALAFDPAGVDARLVRRPGLCDLDLGTAWGLERGAFVGLLAGRAGDRAFDVLAATERTLERARTGLAPGDPAARLPRRWWLRVNLLAQPNPPSSAEEVWHQAVEPASEHLETLQAGGLPGDVTPGFFFEHHFRSQPPDPDLLARWCRALFALFGEASPVLIFHFAGADRPALAALTRRLGPLVAPCGARFEALELPETGPSAPAAGDALREAGAEVARRDTDVAARGSDGNGDLRHLERTLAEAPDRIWTLLRAYPASARPAARRASLCFAARFDPFVDAWLAGAVALAGGEILALLPDVEPDAEPEANPPCGLSGGELADGSRRATAEFRTPPSSVRTSAAHPPSLAALSALSLTPTPTSP